MLPGVWRLRLPLPWPGVPHVNAYAIAAGSGVVLVDTGMHEPGSLAQLELALDQAGLSLDHVRLLVCTHAHSDHYGQAGPIVEASGCELWMHPNHEHMTRAAEDPDRQLERRIEVAPAVRRARPRRWSATARQRKGAGVGIAEVVEPDRDLLPGVEVETDLGAWQVYETPGHAPSHVVLHQPDRKLLLLGDHILGRVSLYYDFGYTPDPAGEFLRQPRHRRARWTWTWCSPATAGRCATCPAWCEANRAAVRERIGRVRDAIAGRAAHAVRDRAEAAGRGGADADARELGPLGDPLLPAPPGAARRGGEGGGRGPRALAGALAQGVHRRAVHPAPGTGAGRS